jgi:hypothetical protein
VLSNCDGSGWEVTCSAFGDFMFRGLLAEYNAAGRELVRWNLVGRGRAEGLFDGTFDAKLVGLNYYFDPAPVPEPATLVLFTIGAGAIGRRAWMAHRRGRAVGVDDHDVARS